MTDIRECGCPAHVGIDRLNIRLLIHGLGCPAHVGIDRRELPAGDRARWLPRTRGDRPIWGIAWDWIQEAAPHTWG